MLDYRQYNLATIPDTTYHVIDFAGTDIAVGDPNIPARRLTTLAPLPQVPLKSP